VSPFFLQLFSGIIMKHTISTIFILGLLLIDIQAQQNNRFKYHTVEGEYPIGNRDITIYLPKNYDSDGTIKYPLLIMMDGQNIFFDSLSYIGHSWRLSQVSDNLLQDGKLKDILIVGIDNATINRFSEYMPKKPYDSLSRRIKWKLNKHSNEPIYSDQFLKYVVNNVIPFMKKKYNISEDSEDIIIGGSSMGGLISMYAVCEYPNEFGGAICMSTHWPVFIYKKSGVSKNKIIDYFSENIPQNKKWYFDFGTLGLDRQYEEHQIKIDEILKNNGYESGKNWITKKFEGHDHNEIAWYSRINIPLKFFFGVQ